MTSASNGPTMPYAAIASVDIAALRWIRVEGGHHDFELRSGDTAVAKLSLSPERGGPARAESIEGRYTIDRAGFLRPRLTLRRDGSSTVLARLVSGPEGLPARHAIEIGGHVTYGLSRAGVSVPAWSISAADGTEWAHLEPIREGRQLLGSVCDVESTMPADSSSLYALILTWCFISHAWLEDEVVGEWTDHAEGRF